MLYRIRTVSGWYETESEEEARRLLSAQPHYVGPAIIEHNRFMNQHYPLQAQKDRTNGR